MLTIALLRAVGRAEKPVPRGYLNYRNIFIIPPIPPPWPFHLSMRGASSGVLGVGQGAAPAGGVTAYPAPLMNTGDSTWLFGNIAPCHSGARPKAASPKSIIPVNEYGFRVRSLRSRPGMTRNWIPMPFFICTACGTQYPDSATPPAQCAICEEERQYVPPRGQSWTTLDALRVGHFNSYREYEKGLIGFGTQPNSPSASARCCCARRAATCCGTAFRSWTPRRSR